MHTLQHTCAVWQILFKVSLIQITIWKHCHVCSCVHVCVCVRERVCVCINKKTYMHVSIRFSVNMRVRARTHVCVFLY